MNSFIIKKTRFGNMSAALMVNCTTGEYAQILPDFGGALNSLSLQSKHGMLELIDGYPNATEAMAETGQSFKSSSLFPFPNRIHEGVYRFNNQDYLLPINRPDEMNAIHGLIYDRKFEVISETCCQDHCSLRLQYTPASRRTGYPFLYCLEQLYQLDNASTLCCTTTIENLEESAIPVGHGWHPYFQFGTMAGTVDDMFLQLPAQKRLVLNDRNLPTGETEQYEIFKNPKNLEQTELDDCFWLSDREGTAVTTLTHHGLSLCLHISQATGKNGYNYCQIYTPPHRTSIAIEPMTCAPNAFNNGMGLIVLMPQEKITLGWSVQLKDILKN